MRARVLTFVLLATLGSFAGPASSEARALRAMPPPPATSVTDVQAHLASIEPDVQRCAESAGVGPSRLMVNVHLFPQGLWSMSFGAPPRSPAIGQRGSTPFEQCVARALFERIGPRTERVQGPRPRTISRRFRITRAVPTVRATPPTVGPLSAAYVPVVRRVIGTRRTQIQACFPHGARAPRTPIRLRLEASPDGTLRLTGLEIPAHLDFANVAQCLERALDGAQGPTLPGTLRGEIPFTVQIDAP